jgi:hypothetical protein
VSEGQVFIFTVQDTPVQLLGRNVRPKHLRQDKGASFVKARKARHQDQRQTPRQDKTNTKTRTDDKTIKRRTKTLEEGRHHLTHSISFHRGLQDKTRQDKIRQDKHQDQTTHDKTCWSLDSSLTGRTRVMHLRSTRQGI